MTMKKQKQETQYPSREGDLAYIAGIVDGEGSISLKKSPESNRSGWSVLLQLAVSNTDAGLVAYLHACFGGSFVCRQTTKRPIYIWCVSANMAAAVLKCLLPYLRVKRPQAELALKFQGAKTQVLARKHKWHEPYKSAEAWAVEEAQHVLMSQLNRGEVV